MEGKYLTSEFVSLRMVFKTVFHKINLQLFFVYLGAVKQRNTGQPFTYLANMIHVFKVFSHAWIMKSLCLVCCLMGVDAYGQDTLYFRNELKSEKNKYMFIDSMFISVNKVKMNIQEKDTIAYEQADDQEDTSRYQVRYFYVELKGNKLDEQLEYRLDLYIEQKHFEIDLPGSLLVKGVYSDSQLFLKTYKGRGFHTFFKEGYGYSFGSWTAVSSIMIPK